MHIDPVKMKAARDRRALTQEALAHQARVNVRTIQRAESGLPVHAETLAEIAAVLGLPTSGLVRPGPVKEAEVTASEIEETQGQVLKRVESGEIIVATLERSAMAVIGCSAEPNSDTMPALRACIVALESMISDPWDAERRMPVRFNSLLDRLDAVAALNEALAALERQGIAVFMAVSSEYVKVPYLSDEGMATHRGQAPEYVRAARFMVADYVSERIRLSADVLWPLQIEPDLDFDDIPF